MNIEIRKRPEARDFADRFDLIVDGIAEIEDSSYAVVDQVRAALEGATWPIGEIHEVADAIRIAHSKPPFKPTICSCQNDQASCKRQPGHLLPGQMKTILAAIGASMAEAGRWFWNSPGMLLGNSETGKTFRIRTITPRFENGRCVFYEPILGRCSIHAVAPFGCRYFDVHMKNKEAQRRARWGVRQILDDHGSYAREREALPEATHYQPNKY